MTEQTPTALHIPDRLRESALAGVVLNGATRKELLAAQVAVASPGTGLRLDHRLAVSLFVDLRDGGWRVGHSQDEGTTALYPPRTVSRARQRTFLSRWRDKNPQESSEWLDAGALRWLPHLIDGRDLQIDRIAPVILPCVTEDDHSLFRFLNASWSAPQGRYLGRRMRLIVRDAGQPSFPVIGILSLGSSIVRCKERDEFIGWSNEVKRQNLIRIMDVTVLGAVPPYSHLLGGKLMCYIAASDQVRRMYQARYRDSRTVMLGRKSSDLALLVTSSLFGRSAIYNRVRFDGSDLFEPIGETGGFGTLHLSPTTMDLMRQILESKNAVPQNRFGDGPNWKMRMVRTACDLLGLDNQAVLRHGLRKSLYAIRTAHNSLEFLNGEEPSLHYRGRPMKRMVAHWKERWLKSRVGHVESMELARSFSPTKWRSWR